MRESAPQHRRVVGSLGSPKKEEAVLEVSPTHAAKSRFETKASRGLGLASALFYCLTSISLIACNKVVLTTYNFPSPIALAGSQFLVTCVLLLSLKVFGRISLASPTKKTFVAAFPLTALYLADVIMGLSATGALSLPMFTCLRRASIPATMILERFVGQNKPSKAVVLSVWGMVLGALVAAMDDLGFDAVSYAMVFTNDALTAARGVYVKTLLSASENDGASLSKSSLLFYNALLSLLVVAPYLYASGTLATVLHWLSQDNDPPSLDTQEGTPLLVFSMKHYAFLLSASLGPVLQYAIFLCTQHNSALTTTVVGALKNIVTAYAGIFLGDYEYSPFNFFGISLSCAASIAYSYAVFISKLQRPPNASSLSEPLVDSFHRKNTIDDEDEPPQEHADTSRQSHVIAIGDASSTYANEAAPVIGGEQTRESAARRHHHLPSRAATTSSSS